MERRHACRFPNSKTPPLAAQVATAFLNDAGPVGQHVPHVPTHPAGDLGHCPLHHDEGLLCGHVDTQIDAGLLPQVETMHRLPYEHGA